MIKSSDHQTAKRYEQDPNKEYFQKHYLKWYHNGGKVVGYKRQLQLFLQELTENGVDSDEIADNANVSRISIRRHIRGVEFSDSKSKEILDTVKPMYRLTGGVNTNSCN